MKHNGYFVICFVSARFLFIRKHFTTCFKVFKLHTLITSQFMNWDVSSSIFSSSFFSINIYLFLVYYCLLPFIFFLFLIILEAALLFVLSHFNIKSYTPVSLQGLPERQKTSRMFGHIIKKKYNTSM